jgi:1,4-dihydroxy-2-naphthoate polyprenyltransferase
MTRATAIASRPVHERGLRNTLSAYARLSNLKVYFQWVPALVAWSLLPAPLASSAGSLLVLLLFVLAVIAVACSAGALDDLQGLRDGLDSHTYSEDQPLRRTRGKPLVQGEIDERAAHRFALLVGAIGLSLGTIAVALGPHGPLWLIACWLLAAFAATQYSYGVKLSYHGAGELLLGLEAAAVMLIPLVALTGHVSPTGCFEAYMLGTLFAQVTVFSSSQDAEIDREFGRMTIAARVTPTANRRFILIVFVLGWTVTAVGFAFGALRPWLALALLPSWSIQIVQLGHSGRQGRWLAARSLGWRAFDAGVLALVSVNLLAR